MAESASLLRKFTGNCNEGSNPSLSATRKPSTKCLAFFMDATEVYFKLWTGKKPKIRQGRSGFLVARLPPTGSRPFNYSLIGQQRHNW